MTLPPEGYQSRFSDSLNRRRRRLHPALNVEISPLVGGEVERRAFIVLAKAHVRLAYPLDERRPAARGRSAARLGAAPPLAARRGVGAEVEEEGEDDDEPLEAVDAVGAGAHITA